MNILHIALQYLNSMREHDERVGAVIPTHPRFVMLAVYAVRDLRPTIVLIVVPFVCGGER